MMTGTVRFFSAEYGYGSISPVRGGIEAAVYLPAVHLAGWTTLERDQAVRYDLSIDRNGKLSAINLEAA
jgi:CspA family cold shock protein